MATMAGVPLYRAAGYTPIGKAQAPEIDGVTVPLQLMGKAI